MLEIFSFSAFGADAHEYYGEFSGEPSFVIKSNDDGRPTFVLQVDFKFTDPNGLEWKAPKGLEVDGASIPQVAWSIVGGPMSGRYIHASIIHDNYCKIKTRTAHDTHRNFYYGMRARGVSETKAKVMYWAVRTFGPSWVLVKRHVMGSMRPMPPLPGMPERRRRDVAVRESIPPDITEQQMEELLKQVDFSLDISKLDRESDYIRWSHGSEPLQTIDPTKVEE